MSYCHAEVDRSKFCPECGASIGYEKAVDDFFNALEITSKEEKDEFFRYLEEELKKEKLK